MKRKITLITAAAVMCVSSFKAQTFCTDLNGFVNSKNIGATGSCVLQNGYEEYAAQTYHYSGPGKIAGARIYGNIPFGGVSLRVGVYNVDNAGRPTTSISVVNTDWWAFIHNGPGYVDVNFNFGGVNVNNKFAITLQLLNGGFPSGNTFNLRYTGNGEGLNQDLASLKGTSTGFNWSSAMVNFNKNGDFYIVPRMIHTITSGMFVPTCNTVGSPISFNNTTTMSKDSMFNKIALASYTGTNTFYSWNFGDGSPLSTLTNPVHTYTAAGVYTVGLTSKIEGWASTCTNVYSKVISVGLSVYGSSLSNVLCNGGSTGSFVAVGQGGAQPYNYSLNGITYTTNPNFTGLNQGIKTLYVRDVLGCISTTTINITQPSAISFVSATSGNASCGGSNGSILASATGGAGTLQYKLNNGALQPSGAFPNLSVGGYTITAQDANACTAATLVVVNDLGGPVFTNINSTNVSCNGGNDGSITLSSSGGIGAILYSIDGGNTFQNNGVFTNVSAGSYAVMVKDNANCSDLATVNINQASQIALTASGVQATCFGSNTGQINVTSSTGGTGNHVYSINGVNYQAGTNFQNLSAGSYTVYVKDATQCVASTNVIVTQPTQVTASINSNSAACNGNSDGTLFVTGFGGTGTYQYNINGSGFQANGTFSNLVAGVYTISVRDANQCTNTYTATIVQPAVIVTTVSTTNSTCGNNNGGLLVIGGGGVGFGFQYSINGINFFPSGMFSPLPAGTHFIIVRDGANCQKVVSATIVDSNGPTIVNSSHTNVSCNFGNDGTISVSTVTGGVGLLQYSINGINWQASSTFTGLTAGTYTATVKDANTCTGIVIKTLTQPSGFLITSAVTNLNCYNNGSGSATISAAGGVGVLAYSIDNGFTFQGSNVFNNLTAGGYIVTVKDQALCLGNYPFQVTQPSSISVSNGILHVTCNGANNGAITLNASGGTSPYQYSINGINYTPSNIFSGLAGNVSYTAYVKDGNNCIQTQSLVITQPASLVVMATISNITCAGGNNGAINLTVFGGIFPYNYFWSNGSQAQGIFNLIPSVYSVNVYDNNGCLAQRTYTLTQPQNPLIANANVTNANGNNTLDGAVDLTVTGGNGPYTFLWSNGAVTEDISGLNPGTYMVTITDMNGCVTSASYVVGNITSISSNVIQSSDITLYPNPTKENAFIDAGGLNIDKIEIMNLLGQKIFESEPKSSSTKINTSELVAGTYFVKIYINNRVVTKRMNISN